MSTLPQPRRRPRILRSYIANRFRHTARVGMCYRSDDIGGTTHVPAHRHVQLRRLWQTKNIDSRNLVRPGEWHPLYHAG